MGKEIHLTSKISSGAQQQWNPQLSKLVLTLWLQGMRQQSHGKLVWAKLQQNTQRHSWSWGSHQPKACPGPLTIICLGAALPRRWPGAALFTFSIRFSCSVLQIWPGRSLPVRQPSRLYSNTCTAFNTERCQFKRLYNILFAPQAGCSSTGSFLHTYPTPSSCFYCPLELTLLLKYSQLQCPCDPSYLWPCQDCHCQGSYCLLWWLPVGSDHLPPKNRLVASSEDSKTEGKKWWRWLMQVKVSIVYRKGKKAASVSIWYTNWAQ